MRNSWNNSEAEKLGGDILKLRVYSSRLLGMESDLVLHGGGNTSAKTTIKNIYGEDEEIIYVKGSGWDLATIEEAGFAAVKLKALQRLAELDHLSDIEMVKYQRMAMIDPASPNPSVEAILHAVIPFTYVDHTHADSVVTISNTPNGKARIQEIYSSKMLVVPYVMPGFLLAKEIYRLTKGMDWDKMEGIILLNHGVFTFHDEAKLSYEKMIDIVTKAEEYIKDRVEITPSTTESSSTIDTVKISRLRQNVSKAWGKPILAHFDNSKVSTAFSESSDLNKIANRGPLTPDHIIRTKRTPVILSQDHEKDILNYAKDYKNYFNEFTTEDLVCLDPAPRWAVWPGQGTLSFGNSVKNCNIVYDISLHTMKAILEAEQFGKWHTLSKNDLFNMEYWVLEQEKLKRDKTPKPMQAKIALVTGAASGIGKACVEKLVDEGAVVAALDIDPVIKACYGQDEVISIECDITNKDQLKNAIKKTITHYGGLDLLVANAGIFPESYNISDMNDSVWNKSLEVNVTGHQQLLKLSLPYLELGMEPAVVIIGSKNVLAPGPGASAYSVAKAGLTQLGRIAALEFGEKGIRVNMLHPNAVYDTNIWTDEIVRKRAEHYKLTVEEYKANNILKVTISSRDVAILAVSMLGSTFSKTTGAQVTIDGGNDRVI
jgi:rhamnose utilization protein RhaD (predicted bifunctional aldolase and dehydrogenase)/NAD(P)-dependent dehydrogenase (short-subunit alcohol dehydrogenase family)